MLSTDVRKLSLKLFGLIILAGLAVSLVQKADAGDGAPPDPFQCNLNTIGCNGYCSTLPPDQFEGCLEQCRIDQANCQSRAFSASLSPENFSLPVSTGCSKHYNGYLHRCNSGYSLLPRHQPIYDACINAGLSSAECCDDVAMDFAMGLLACNE